MHEEVCSHEWTLNKTKIQEMTWEDRMHRKESWKIHFIILLYIHQNWYLKNTWNLVEKNILRLISVWKICSTGLQKVTVRRYSHISLVNSEIKFYIILQFRCQIKLSAFPPFLVSLFPSLIFKDIFFQNFLQWFQIFKINCGRSVTETLWQEYYLLIHIFHGKNISGERKKRTTLYSKC